MSNVTAVSLAAPAQVRDPLLDDRAWMASAAFLVAKSNGLDPGGRRSQPRPRGSVGSTPGAKGRRRS